MLFPLLGAPPSDESRGKCGICAGGGKGSCFGEGGGGKKESRTIKNIEKRESADGACRQRGLEQNRPGAFVIRGSARNPAQGRLMFSRGVCSGSTGTCSAGQGLWGPHQRGSFGGGAHLPTGGSLDISPHRWGSHWCHCPIIAAPAVPLLSTCPPPTLSI